MCPIATAFSHKKAFSKGLIKLHVIKKEKQGIIYPFSKFAWNTKSRIIAKESSLKTLGLQKCAKLYNGFSKWGAVFEKHPLNCTEFENKVPSQSHW